MKNAPKVVPLRWETMSLFEIIFLCKNVDFKPINEDSHIWDMFAGADENSLIAFAEDISGREFVLILDMNELYIQDLTSDEINYVIYTLSEQNR